MISSKQTSVIPSSEQISGLKIIMLGLTTLVLLGGLTVWLNIGGFWDGVSRQYDAWMLKDWQLGLKAVYPDAKEYQQAEQELQALGTGDQEKIKAIFTVWHKKQPNACSQLPMESADALILWGSAPSQATLTCAEIVAARKALAKLTSQPSNTIALPFLTNAEQQHWEGYFTPLLDKAKPLSPAQQGDCAKPSTSDYQQLSCLARAASAPASPYQDSKNDDRAYKDEACKSLSLDKAACESTEQGTAITNKMEELKDKAKTTWEAAQQQRQTALAPFKDFKQLAGDEYKPLRQLLGLE